MLFGVFHCGVFAALFTTIMAAVALFMVGRLAKFNDIFTSTVPTINNFSNHALRINCLTLFVQLKIPNNILFLYTTAGLARIEQKYLNDVVAVPPGQSASGYFELRIPKKIPKKITLEISAGEENIKYLFDISKQKL